MQAESLENFHDPDYLQVLQVRRSIFQENLSKLIFIDKKTISYPFLYPLLILILSDVRVIYSYLFILGHFQSTPKGKSSR